MDDDIRQGWSVDPELRLAMRLDQVRKQVDRMAWPEAVLEAEELLHEAPDHVETLELLARAQLGMMDAEGAVLSFEQLHALDPAPRPDRLAGLATARLDTCDLVGAAQAAREAVRLEPGLAEAHHVLGLALDHLPGRRTEAAQAFVAANRLDPLAYPFPMRLDASTWEQALTTAMLHLPGELRSLWEGVPVQLPARPDLDELRAHAPPLSPRILGMFVGTPPEDADPWDERPDALTLFTENVARVSSLDELVERISHVLEQEALAWVGEDPWADDLELEEL
jgi:tetratricopeptide (TPR) repeat protein